MSFRQWALGLSFAAAFLSAHMSASLAENQAVTVTEPAHSIDSMPFYVAMKEGFFAKHGIDMKLVTAEGGSQHIAAVLSGSADAYIGGPEHNAFALLQGKKLKAVLSLSNRASAYIVAKPGLGLTAQTPIKDILKGRTIAVGAAGGTHNALLRAMLAEQGLDPTKDVTLIEVNTTAGILAAMKAGKVDLAVTAEPQISQGIKEEIWTDALVSYPKYFGPFEYTTLNVPQKLIDTNPTEIKNMVAALKEALEFSFKNPDKVKELARAEFPTMPVDDLDAMLNRTLADGLWERSGETSKKGWEQDEKIVQDAGMLSRPVTYEEIFDTQFQ